LIPSPFAVRTRRRAAVSYQQYTTARFEIDISRISFCNELV
jgi:hypothetical protein